MVTKATLSKARALVTAIAQKGCEIDHLIAQLRALKLSWGDYKTLRESFIGAYCEAKGASPEDKATNAAARKAWSRILQAAGVERPLSESEEAQRKRAARQAKAAADTKAVVSDEGAPEAPASGALAGTRVQMELTASEAHLVRLVRRGLVAAAVDYLHKLAEAAGT